ncbi:MAG: sulfatase, partial [Myxococcota bacterium]
MWSVLRWPIGLALVSAGLLVSTAEGASARPNFLVIVVDTLRADALGAYGQKLPTTPNLDALAKKSVVFDRAWTQYTWTLPSYVTYMSSRFARTHGGDFAMGKLSTYEVLDDRAPMLAQVLRENGYATAGHYANEHIRADLGMSRGFSTWVKGADVGVTRAAIADIGRWKDDGKPNFLYAHFMAPHEPLVPSADSLKVMGSTLTVDPSKGVAYDRYVKAPEAEKAAIREELRLAYLACVRDADANIGRILATLEASGEAQNTVVVFFSDHGELLGEHDAWGHTSHVWEELTHVPLMVSVPGVAPRRVTDRVGRLVDIAPMVTRLASVKAPAQWQGQDLLGPGPAAIGVSERDARVVFSTDARTKITEDREKGTFFQAVDLGSDPDELR